jgi:hypothetical protein
MVELTPTRWRSAGEANGKVTGDSVAPTANMPKKNASKIEKALEKNPNKSFSWMYRMPASGAAPFFLIEASKLSL